MNGHWRKCWWGNGRNKLAFSGQNHVSVHGRVPCISIAHTWNRKVHFVRIRYINVWSRIVGSDGTGFRKCWVSLEDCSDVMDSLGWLAVTSSPWTFPSCIKWDLAQWFSGDTQKAPCSSQCSENAAQKGFRETVSTSLWTVLCWCHTQWLSNRIYLWIKREALKQLIS